MALIETLVAGGRNYGLHDPLRRYDKRTARCLQLPAEANTAQGLRDLMSGRPRTGSSDLSKD
jgi:hypothetical protein